MGRTQGHLSSRSSSSGHGLRIDIGYTNAMVHGSLNLLTQHSIGGVLGLDDIVPCGEDSMFFRDPTMVSSLAYALLSDQPIFPIQC